MITWKILCHSHARSAGPPYYPPGGASGSRTVAFRRPAPWIRAWLMTDRQLRWYSASPRRPSRCMLTPLKLNSSTQLASAIALSLAFIRTRLLMTLSCLNSRIETPYNNKKGRPTARHGPPAGYTRAAGPSRRPHIRKSNCSPATLTAPGLPAPPSWPCR